MYWAVAVLVVLAAAAGACGSEDPPAATAPTLTIGEGQVCHMAETLAAIDRVYAELVSPHFLSPDESARMTRHIRRTEHRLATELAKRADNETVGKSIRDLARDSAEYRMGRTAWALGDDPSSTTPASDRAQLQPVAPADREAAARRNRLEQLCLDN